MLKRRRKRMTMRLDRPPTWGERVKGALILLWKAGVLAGLLVGFYYAERALLYFLYESPFFAVKTVEVYDLPRPVAENFRAMPSIEGLKGRNLFLLDSKSLSNSLEKIPTLKNVRVRKRLPDTLEIHALERVPVAAVSAVNFYYYDMDGVCVGRVPGGQFPPAQMAIISGVESLKVRIGQPYKGTVVREGIDLMRVLRDTNFGGRDQISEFHWDEQEGWVLIFTSGAEVKLGRQTLGESLAKLDYLYRYLQGFDQLRVADMRFKQQIPFQLKPSS